MTVDKKMLDRDNAVAPAQRRWTRPALTRLEAGAAEAGTRTVINDGPLGSKS